MNQEQRLSNMSFASVYPYYLNKILKKGRQIEELHQIITWLCGYDESEIQQAIEEKISFEVFFAKARLHPNAVLITGSICGYRIELISHPLTRQIRCLDKLVDELAKGRKMEKILRAG